MRSYHFPWVTCSRLWVVMLLAKSVMVCCTLLLSALCVVQEATLRGGACPFLLMIVARGFRLGMLCRGITVLGCDTA